MGEADEPKKTALAQASEDVRVAQTMGGRMHVRWDETAQVTPHGQVVFCSEFLSTAGVFDRWVDACRLHYSSPNASRTRDVLGTLMLGIMAGSKRYAHIAGIRGDAVAAQALGQRGLVSEDSVRRTLKAMEVAASESGMRGALMDSVREALDRAWVQDIDATIKPLYECQEGAEVGYNPHGPGRPSHVLYTSGHAKAALGRLLENSASETRRWCAARCGYGNEDTIDVCEQRGRAYLLRLRKTANVKRRADRAAVQARGLDASQGWQVIEDSIKLSGWSKARRVVVVRRRIKHDNALTAATKGRRARDDAEQLVLALAHDEVQDDAQMWDYTVLVTNAKYDIAAIGQLYRDRCDCENGFDELRNQGHEGAPSWPLGWGGFTTHGMHRSQITVRVVVLVYNRWSWYVRAAHPQA